MQTSPYNPVHVNMYGLGSALFARRYLGYRKKLLPVRNGTPQDCSQGVNRPERNFRLLLSFPLLTKMFQFRRFAPAYTGYVRNT